MIPNEIVTYLCGTKNGKKICHGILDCREMGVKVLKVTMRTHFFVSPTPTNGFEMCAVLNANHGLW